MERPFPPTKTAGVQTSTPQNASVATLRLQSALKRQLLQLPFAAFASCICDLLRAEGYTDVRLSGRVTYLGRNKEGGFDLEAYLPSPLNQNVESGGVLRRKVIVQVKQFPQEVKVYQRTLDALRGACLRTGAIEAVLVTTSDFSPVVRNTECVLRREAASSSLAPVHLLNGEALVGRLIAHRIGVQEKAGSDLGIDPAYFARLQEAVKPANHAKNSHGTSPTTRHEREQLTLRASISRTQAEVTVTLPLTLFAALSENRQCDGTKGGA